MQYGKVPLTNAATAAGIYIIGGKAGGEKHRIGAIMSLTESITRSNTRRFEIDADFPGRTTEIIPGKINGLSLEVKRAVLFKKSKAGDDQSVNMLSDLMQTEVYDMLYQRSPVDIEKHMVSPKDGADSVVVYKDCFLSSMRHNIDISGEWMIVEDATFDVSYIDYEGAKMV